MWLDHNIESQRRVQSLPNAFCFLFFRLSAALSWYAYGSAVARGRGGRNVLYPTCAILFLESTSFAPFFKITLFYII